MAFGQTTLKDLETTREGESVGVQLLAHGRFEHHRANHEMGQRQGVQFLNHSRGRFAAQVGRLAGPPWVLMRLLPFMNGTLQSK